MKIRLDIDDTILYSEIDRQGNYHLIESNENLIKKINKLYDEGTEIIVDTGRNWNHLKITIEQLKACGLKYTTLTMGKPHCDYMVDDKAVSPEYFLGLDI